MATTKNDLLYTVLAPHIDDEVIGCFRILKAGLVKDVYYFYNLTDERIAEAERCSRRFGFTPHFYGEGTWIVLNQDQATHRLLVPSISDQHPQHKEINLRARKEFYGLSFRTMEYYSVDMNVRELEILSHGEQVKKRSHLFCLFPSQARLFERDDKYHLFEACFKSDFARQIFITTKFEGIHCYPAAPEAVAFLRNPHRHVFGVRIELDVFHDDRELEFILFKQEIDHQLYKKSWNLHTSCEMMAEVLLNYVINKYPKRNCSVTVDEDGENGATVKYKYA